MLEKLVAEILSKFGMDLVEKYLDRKDQWDRVALEIEGKAKDYAMVALDYLRQRGDLDFRLRDDAGEILLPGSTASLRRDAPED